MDQSPRPTNFALSRHIVYQPEAIDPDDESAFFEEGRNDEALKLESSPDDIRSMLQRGRPPGPPSDSYSRVASLPRWRELRRKQSHEGPIHDLMLSFRRNSMDLSLLLVRNTVNEAPTGYTRKQAPSLEQIVGMLEGRMTRTDGPTQSKTLNRTLVLFLHTITPETTHQLEILRPKIEQHADGHALSIWTESVIVYLMHHHRYDAAVCLFYHNFICPYVQERVKRVAEEYTYRHFTSESLPLSAPRFRRDTWPRVMRLILRCLVKLSSGPEDLLALHTETMTKLDVSGWLAGAHILIFIRAFIEAAMSDPLARILAESDLDMLIHMGHGHSTLLHAYAMTYNLPKVLQILELLRPANFPLLDWEQACTQTIGHLHTAGSATGAEMIRMYYDIFVPGTTCSLTDADVPRVLNLLDSLKLGIPGMCSTYNRIAKLFRRSSSLSGVKAVFAHGVAAGEWSRLRRGAFRNVSSPEAWMHLRSSGDLFTHQHYQELRGSFFIATPYTPQELQAFFQEAKTPIAFESLAHGTRYTLDELETFIEEAYSLGDDDPIEEETWPDRETQKQLSIMASIKDIERFCFNNHTLDDTHLPFILKLFDRLKSTVFAAGKWSRTDPIAGTMDTLYRNVAEEFRRSKCAVGVWAVLRHRDRRSDIVIPPSKPATRVLAALTESGPRKALKLLQDTRAQLSQQDLVSVFDAFVKAKYLDGALVLEEWLLEDWDTDPPMGTSLEAISEPVRVLWTQSGRRARRPGTCF